ncbi:F-box only protein 30 [Parasteatoda tepidariorum]|uniref:F-box only protein 30 n=1 Tax=Parasteatoda tepidariorum TaxID=114398 RepID=UPI00077FB02A|nr:F-box only protein 30 [Parasteatoda tepidariorum]XP_042900827.1 F-box only protein 30 [Parasteatoda tepidariorum]XP_042900828.1 F-box only protein 30 [Parasteatoda tepidariorum]
MEDHIHCNTCVKWMKCMNAPVIPGESCKIISCPLDCGAKYHACKGEEHKHLCMNEKVACINAEFGCPSMMLRKNRSKHLPSCPASIIHCSEEWDRWPIHFHKKSPTHCQAQLDSTLKGHLDVSLAMRDQRMLRRWCVAASQGQSLNDQKFTISPSSSLWIFRKWQSSREYSYPPGLQQSVCKELCKTCKRVAKNASSQYSNGNSNSNCVSKTVDKDAMNSIELSDKENSGDYNNIQTDKSEQNSLNKLKFENNNVSIPEKAVSELPHYNLDDVLQLSQFGTIVYNQASGERSIYVAVDPADTYYLNTCLDNRNMACQILDLKFRNPSSTPPWCLSLGLDLNLESRSLHPPSNFMYTFLCSQEFRRDQYGWHFKNVHSEIHGGLNGWLIERCPLAQYGCKFARRRFNPESKNSDIVYNENLESFGISYSSTCNKENVTEDAGLKSSSHAQSFSLLDMPFDVLQHIVRFLDSFSLANLSLTSTLLRDVCSTILKDRGLVHLKWERYKLNDGKYSWRVAKKMWFFSSHFSPIHRWTVESKDNMSSHLKTCPYFNRISQKKAFGYEHSRNIGHPLDKRFCDPFNEFCEHNTTKL